MNILLISGKKQSGKSTLADYIKSHYRNSKEFAFADSVKNMLIQVMGLSRESVYGSDKEKNKLTNYRIENLPGYKESSFSNRAGFASGRDLMKYFATEVFRKIDPDMLANSTYKQAEKLNPGLAIISDCRYPNEIYIGKRKGAKSIRLTKAIYSEDLYDSEIALDPYRYDWGNFDLVIDNVDMTPEETFKTIWQSMIQWGWECDLS